MTASANDRPLPAGTLIATNYRVTQRLGEGGMGTVYLAENVTLTTQKVVVKVLRGGQTGAGQEEALLLASLHHPNVVTVFAHDVTFDCIVMEFLDGASLSSLLEKGIDRINAIRIGIAVAEALAAVHRRGLVHRDIKPENVMLALNTGSGRLVDWLKLIDFGLALKEGKTPQVLLGTPEYCGPEQFFLQEPAHPGNDVYALGVTLFLMLTGTFPFEGPSGELPRLHVEVPPPSLLERLRTRPRPGLDPRTIALLEDLDELVQQMMSKVVSQRPTAPEVARRLNRLENSFSEAGTFVGAALTPASSDELQPVGKRRTSTSVLQRMSKPKPPPAGDTTSTAPNLVPTAVSTDELRPVPGKRTSAPPPERVAAAVAAPSARRFPVALVAGLSVLVVLLAVALVSVKPNGDGATEPTLVVKDLPVEAPAEVEKPPPPVAPPPVEKPPDPPVAVADEPEQLPALPRPDKVKPPPKQPKAEVVKAPPRVAPCSWDRDGFREKYQAAALLLPDPEAFDAEMQSVKAAADCARAEALLQKMKLQAKPR